MELFLALLVLLGLALVVVAGHLIWLGVAALLRRRPAETDGGAAVDSLAQELGELETVRRQVRQLYEGGDLDRATAERLFQAVQSRRLRLGAAAASPARQLERLLGGGTDPRILTPRQRQEALALYRRLNAEERASLAAPALLMAARLLRLAGLASRALEAYRCLLENHPGYEGAASAALEAGRFGAREGMADLAYPFLEQALALGLSGQDREEAGALLRYLGRKRVPQAAREEEVLEAIPVLPAPAPASRERERPETPVADAPGSPAPVADGPGSPERPRRRWADVLATFMEERNILWGELAGGLLIVGCSIALVITLWQSLEELPYFPFLIFAAITAALYGAGEYTLHHWKLAATSRGLLVIALLLAPLNLLALTDPGQVQVSGALDALVKAGVLLLAVGLVRGAGRDLIGTDLLPGPIDRRWLLSLAVAGAAGSQLVLPRPAGAGILALFLLLGGVPAACHLAAGGAVVAGLARAVRRGRPLEDRQAGALFLFLGVSSFALLAALGFLLSQSADIPNTLRLLAVPLAAAGIPVLAGGLLVQQSIAPAGTANVRTAGTAVAAGGVAAMLLGVALAWPHPWPLLAACLLDGMVLAIFAFRLRLPGLHAAALPCLALAFLLVCNLPSVDTGGAGLAAMLFAASSGVELLAAVAILALLAEVLARKGQQAQAVAHALGSAGCGMVSLLTTTWHGLESPSFAATAFLVCGVCALGSNFRWQRRSVPYVGLGLLVAGSLWTLEAMDAGLALPAQQVRMAFAVSLEAALLALLAAFLPGSAAWGLLRCAGRDTARAIGFLALVGAVTAFDPGAALHAGTAAALAAAAFLLAWESGSPGWTWVGAELALVGIAHLCCATIGAAALPRPLLVAMLAFTALALGGGYVAGRIRPPAGPLPPSERSFQSLYAVPLGQAARLVSVLAVLLFALPGDPRMLAGCAAWLAALWLLIACAERSPQWFTAFQGALAASILFAITAWLGGQQWVQNPGLRMLSPLLEPRSLHAYGIGLALLGLAGALARLALSRSALVRELLPAAWPSPDRVLLGVVVVGQFLLALGGIAGGVGRELHAGFGWAADARTWDAGAWLLLGVLALALAASLWRQVRFPVVLGLLTLAATVPVLAAGLFDAERATASALRWGEALCFLAGSALVWLRRPLGRVAGRIGIEPAADSSAGRARDFLLGIAGTVIFLTLMVAIDGFQGTIPGGPAPGSPFARMGWVPSSVGPMVLVVAGLVGHALRERGVAYAFAAGLLADLTLVGGYALAVVTGGGWLGEADGVRCLQLASLGMALWALVWLPGRLWPWRLLRVQIGLALAGVFLLAGLVAFVWGQEDRGLGPWAVEAGSPLGWLTFAAAVGAPVVGWRQRNRPLPWGLVFAAGLAAVCLAAGSIEGFTSGAGDRALLLGWAGYLLLWALLPYLGRGRLPEWSSVRFYGAEKMAEGIAVPGAVAVLWALHVALVLGAGLAGAATVGLVSLACALVAAWRGVERLAFLAGLCANLAVSLLVAHAHRPLPVGNWLVPLVQANAMTGAAVALVWLLVRRPSFLRVLKERSIVDTEYVVTNPGPLLVFQGMLGLAVQSLLLLAPLAMLMLDPGRALPPDFFGIGLAGWLVGAAVGAAALLVLGEIRPRERLHVLGLCGLSIGVVAACAVIPWDRGNWLSYHALLAAWGSLGLAAVAAGSLAVALRRAGLAASGGEPRTWRFADLFPASGVRRWLEIIGLAVVLLALRGAGQDPLRPLVPAAATFLVSLMAGALALWTRRGSHVYASGLLLDVAGLWLWGSWGEESIASFLLANALGLGLAAGFWGSVHLAWPLGVRRESVEAGDWPPFPHLAAACCLALLALTVGGSLVLGLLGGDFGVPEGLAWAALAATGLALLVLLWDRGAVHAPAGLYGLGLPMLAQALQGLSLRGIALEGAATGGLACYAVLASLLAWTTSRSTDLADRLHLPPRRDGWPGRWFVPAQALLGDVLVLLSLHVCLASPILAGRLMAPGALLLLAAGELLLAATSLTGGGDWLKPAALVVGAVAAGEAAWALPDPHGTAPWLHRNALLVVALTLTSALYGTALPRWLRGRPAWVGWGRRLGPTLGALAALTLLVLLCQEFALYDKDTRHTPLALPAVLVVVAAVGLLMFSGIRFAVVPGRDPLGLSERGRGLYVYAVEVLLVLLFVHVRLNLPELFSGWAGRYWTILIVLIAFLGVGLSEFFERRGLRVLAGPLQRTGVFLPLLPLLAFWGRPLAPLLKPAAERTPALGPWVGYLEKLPGAYDSYALLWFLTGLLYAVLAQTRRSFRFALLAALAANAGIWALLAHHGVAFLVHPQAWLIPLGLILLVSENVNRARLRPEVALGLRYLGISLVYVASTADLFIAGVGNSLLPPILLAVLAVLGMLAGIVLRVRAFLFVGVSFLLLDVFTMIWHAAVDRYHTWVWWASGIVLGVAILALFAVFEKRRNDVLRLIDEIKRWD